MVVLSKRSLHSLSDEVSNRIESDLPLYNRLEKPLHQEDTSKIESVDEDCRCEVARDADSNSDIDMDDDEELQIDEPSDFDPACERAHLPWSPNRSPSTSEDHSSTCSDQSSGPFTQSSDPDLSKTLFFADDFNLSPSQYYAYSQSHTKSKFYRAPFFVLAAILVAVSAMYTSRTTVIATAEQVSMLRLNREKVAEQLKHAEKDIMKLKREIAAVETMLANQISSGYEAQRQLQVHADPSPEILSSAAVSSIATAKTQQSYEEMRRLREHLRQQASTVDTLKDKVQTLGKREVRQKWGDGIHRVEFELVFPDANPVNSRTNQLHRYPDGVGPTTFVVELAPLEAMPHSVHTFLEMVTFGLLDGCSFILNALHVLKAAPLPYDGTSAAEKAKAFSAHGLESVAFKEYNPEYPHKQYTVGFAADGSPSFYINTEDNTEIHVGDPCFAKVVEGFDTIKRLEACPTHNGIWFEKRIGIKQARLLTDLPQSS